MIEEWSVRDAILGETVNHLLQVSVELQWIVRPVEMIHRYDSVFGIPDHENYLMKKPKGLVSTGTGVGKQSGPFVRHLHTR